MTANAINTAVPNAAAMAGSTAAGGAPANDGALAGFEALMAALFPQGNPNAQAVAAAPGGAVSGKATVAAVNPDAEGKPEAQTDGQVEVVETADAATADPNAALAASLAGAQLTLADAAATKAPAPATDGPPPARTPGAAKRLHNERVLQGPDLTGKGELANEAAPEGEVAETPLATPTLAQSKPTPETPKSAPPAWGRDKAPGTPAAPALANAAAHAAPDVVDQPPPPEAPAPAAPAAVEAAQPAVTTAAVARPEPQAVTPKPTKAERGKAADRGVADPDAAKAAPPAWGRDKAPGTPAAPALANSAARAAPDAATSEADAVTSAAPESPDSSFSAETQAAPASSAAPAQASTHAVRGSPETVANLAAQIIKKLEGQSTRFDVELDPAGLGKVNVRVEIGAHGAMTAAMTFDNPQAAQELRARAAELQRALEQAGFNLSSALSFDVAQDRGQHPHGQTWQDQGDAGRAFRGQAFRAALDTADDAAQAAQNGALRLRRGVSAGLDVRI